MSSEKVKNQLSNRIWLVVGVLLTLIGIAGVGIGIHNTLGATDATNIEQQNQTYQGNITKIDVTVDAGDLVVTAGSGSEVNVHRVLQWDQTKPTISEQVEGTTLRISQTCPHAQRCGTDYRLTVPTSVAVQAHLAAGNTTITGIAGNVDLVGESGQVSLTNLGGSIHVQETSGTVFGTGLGSTATDVHSASGSISLAFAVAPTTIEATAESGDVTVRVPGSDRYRVQAQTASGTQRISVNQDSAAERSITARTSSGNITVTPS